MTVLNCRTTTMAMCRVTTLLCRVTTLLGNTNALLRGLLSVLAVHVIVGLDVVLLQQLPAKQHDASRHNPRCSSDRNTNTNTNTNNTSQRSKVLPVARSPRIACLKHFLPNVNSSRTEQKPRCA